MRICLSASLICLLTISSNLWGQVPSISRVTPQGITPGATTQIKISGGNLANVKQLQASFPGTFAPTEGIEQKPNELTYNVTIPANIPCGIHALRVLTASGVTQPSIVVVDRLPVVVHTNQNKSHATAQSVPAECVVEGHVDNLSRLYFRFPGNANQSFSVEVQARRLGSALDPTIRLFDPNGKEIAWSDDEPGLQGDCYLKTTLQMDGEFTIELSDIRYQGSGNHRFRLRLGNFALLTTTDPMVVYSKSESTFSLAGLGLSGPYAAQLSPESIAAAQAQLSSTPLEQVWIPPTPAELPSNPELASAIWPMIGVSEFLQVNEVEPNNTAEQSQRIELGHGINGRSDQPGDIDRFIFTAKKGQKFTFNAVTRSAGAPTDLTMRILKPDGAQLATVEDTGLTDGQVDVTFPEDGDYTLEVRDLHERGGVPFAWHVDITEIKPQFTLTASEDTFNIPTGGVVAVQVNAQRKGYGGPIQVAMANLPAGITSHPTVIGPGRNDAILTIQSSKDAKVESLTGPQIIGSAEISGATFQTVASLHDHLKGSMNNVPWPSRNLIYSYATALTVPAPVNLRLEPPEVVLGPNLSAKFKIIAERSEGWDGDIALAINPAKNGLPANITFGPQPIKKGTNEIELTIAATEKAALGDFTIGMTGTIKKDKATSAQPVPGLFLKVQVPLTVAVEPAGGTIAKGGELKFKVAITRNPALAGEAALTVANLPAGVTAETVAIPADQAEAEVILKAAADAAPADVKNLQIKADIKVGEKTITANSATLPLKVE